MTTAHYATNSEGVAIEGFDPVAYFAAETAQRGSPDVTREWAGATWHFVSEANADRFVADPAAYAPAFGGRCAFGAAFGKQADASPMAWRIIDGRLFLMKSGTVRALSRLFTRRISAATDDPKTPSS